MMKKVTNMLVVVIMLVSLLAGGIAQAAADEPVTLTAVVTSDPGSLTPYGTNRGGKQAVRSAVFEPLFWLDADKNLRPILAKSYEYKGGGVYDVEIFDYIYDSAGNHLTASDVAYSIDLMIADGHMNGFIGSLTDHKAVGEYTVELTFGNENKGNFETLVTYCYCVTQAAWEASPDAMVTDPIGTGLYLYTGGTAGSEYDFEARDGYWQTDADYICAKNTLNVDKLILKIITDPSTIAIALENGEIDYTQNIEEADRANFINEDGTAKAGYSREELTNAALIRLSFNCSDKSICSDINLRKAIATCIDDYACAFLTQGSFGHVCTSLMNPIWLDSDEALNNTGSYYDYDEQTARDYLAKSNYNGETLRVLVQPNTNTSRSAVLMQAYAKAIGIDMELLQYESALYTDANNDETGDLWDICIFGLGSTNSYTWKQMTELDINQYKTGVNHLIIADETLQDLYDKAANVNTSSPETANDLIQYVTDQCYEYALFYYNICYIGTDHIQEIVTGAGNSESIYNAFVIVP